MTGSIISWEEERTCVFFLVSNVGEDAGEGGRAIFEGDFSLVGDGMLAERGARGRLDFEGEVKLAIVYASIWSMMTVAE